MNKGFKGAFIESLRLVYGDFLFGGRTKFRGVSVRDKKPQVPKKGIKSH